MVSKTTPRTPGPWRQGRDGTVVCDSLIGTHHGDYPETGSDRSYYGGYLVAESIATEANCRFIAMAPEMFELLESLENEAGTIPPGLWARVQLYIAIIKKESTPDA